MRAVRGRDNELAVLRELVDAVACGTGGVVRVEGPAGIGKSTLLAAVGRMAAGQRLIAAAAAADELDQVTPWGPLLRALAASDPPLLTAPDVESLRSSPEQRMAAIEVLRAALEQVSPSQAVLVTIDDLQWADAATLHALGALAEQLFSYPVAWVLASRPRPTSAALDGLTARLDRAGARVLRLAPLAPDAVRQLAADLLGSDLKPTAEQLAAQAEGNPLFVVELLRTLADEATHAGDGRGGQRESMRGSVRAVVAAYLRSLSAPARRLLDVGSVLGREFSVAEVAEMTGRPAVEWLAGIEEALAADVLTEAGDRLAFRHDLLRQSVYADLPGSARQALHRDAAQALRSLGVPPVRIASHIVIAAEPGDEYAISMLGQVSQEIFPAMPGAAADLAVRALDLIGEDDARRPAMIARAVGMLGWVRRLDEARALGEGYLASHRPPLDVAAAIMLGVRRAWATRSIRPYAEPLPHGLTSDPAVPPGTRANLIAFEQRAAICAGDTATAERELAVAAELVSGSGDPAERSAVDYFRVICAQQRGQLGEALARAQEGLAMIDPHRSGPISAHPRTDVAVGLGGLGRTEEALASLGQAMGFDEAVALTAVTLRGQGVRAALLLDLGRIDDARSEARAAAAAAEDLRSLDTLAFALGTLAEAAVLQEDFAEASAAAERLRAVPSPLWAEEYWAAALVADAAGDARAAIACLGPVFARLQAGQFLFAARLPGRLPRVVELALRAGDRDMAEVAARASAELASMTPDPTLRAAAAHARGLLAGDPGELRHALEVSATDKRPLVHGRICEHLGRVLLSAGSTAEAVAQFQTAFSAFAGCGSRRETRRVRAQLRSLGVHKRQAAVARPERGWQSLTKSELAVVLIVAEGRTNREAAAALFLSPDTINTHLRHAFTKLGVRSRIELARLALTREQ